MPRMNFCQGLRGPLLLGLLCTMNPALAKATLGLLLVVFCSKAALMPL